MSDVKYDAELCERLEREAREDDARMTPAPWEWYDGTYLWCQDVDQGVLQHAGVKWAMSEGNKLGIVRMRANLRAMADQLAAAGSEVVRIDGELLVAKHQLAAARAEVARLTNERLGAVLEVDQLTKHSEALQETIGTERDVGRLQRRLREAKAEIERLRRVGSAGDLIADLCGGVIGADDDDRVGTIKAHFSDRPSMWLRDAMIDAVDAYRAARDKAGQP